MKNTPNAVTRDGSGTKVEDTALGGALAAGFENWRTQVWGSPLVRALGAEYFPRLDGADLFVHAGEVTAFLRECALVSPPGLTWFSALAWHIGAGASGPLGARFGPGRTGGNHG
jgi:hypothetical protein